LRSSGVMPPSPVVVDVPSSVAARPRASFAGAESAPKLMPAIVIGIFSSIGRAACRVPSVTSVPHFSRYPSSGYRDTLAPSSSRSSKCGTRRFAPKPRMS